MCTVRLVGHTKWRPGQRQTLFVYKSMLDLLSWSGGAPKATRGPFLSAIISQDPRLRLGSYGQESWRSAISTKTEDDMLFAFFGKEENMTQKKRRERARQKTSGFHNYRGRGNVAICPFLIISYFNQKYLSIYLYFFPCQIIQSCLLINVKIEHI